MKQKLVLIGNGMAGLRTVEELLKLDPALYDITIFGAEPHPNYNRIMLSPVLAGEKTIDDIAREEALRAHVVLYLCDGDLSRQEAEALGRPVLALCNTIWYRDDAYYAVGWREPSDIRVDLAEALGRHGVNFIGKAAAKVRPDENRIELASDQDQFGFPLAKVTYKISEEGMKLWTTAADEGVKLFKAVVRVAALAVAILLILAQAMQMPSLVDVALIYALLAAVTMVVFVRRQWGNPEDERKMKDESH